MAEISRESERGQRTHTHIYLCIYVLIERQQDTYIGEARGELERAIHRYIYIEREREREREREGRPGSTRQEVIRASTLTGSDHARGQAPPDWLGSELSEWVEALVPTLE